MAHLAIVADLEGGEAQVLAAGAGIRLAQHHDLLAPCVGEGLEEHAVDEAEDGGVGADAETQREHDGGGEARAAAQAAQAVADVLHQHLEEPAAARVAASLLGLVDAAKRDDGRAPGLLRGHAAPDVGRRLEVEMQAHLVVELCLQLLP